MNKFAFMIFLSIFLIAGCSQTVTRFQCQDGSFANSEIACAYKACPGCPTLDCNTCPAKIEYEDRIVEKTVEVAKYFCADGKEVTDKTSCIDYVNPNWSLSGNKEQLVSRLNAVPDPLGFNAILGKSEVEVTKLIEDGTNLEIGYTTKSANYQANVVGQTMFAVLKETVQFLKENNKLNYNIEIVTITSNGGFIFSRKTTKDEILKILNYDLSMDEWIKGIKQSN